MDPKKLCLLSIDSVQCYERTVQGNIAQFDVTNSKVKIFQTGAALRGLLSEAIAGISRQPTSSGSWRTVR